MVSAGNVEGGGFMVLKPGVALCGFSGESSIEPAVQQIKGWFEAEGWEFHTYAFGPHFLHLDVQMGMVAENLTASCRAEGLKVYDPDVSMIGNGGGAVHCMCQALRRDPTAP